MNKQTLLEAINKLVGMGDLEGIQHMVNIELKKERTLAEAIPQNLMECLDETARLNELDNVKPLMDSLKAELKTISQHIPSKAIWEVCLSTLSNQYLSNMEGVLIYTLENNVYRLKFHFEGVVVEMLGRVTAK